MLRYGCNCVFSRQIGSRKILHCGGVSGNPGTGNSEFVTLFKTKTLENHKGVSFERNRVLRRLESETLKVNY